MTTFGEWLKRQAADQLHPLGDATQSHLRFVTLQPFTDGKGHTARLLVKTAAAT